MIKNHLLMQNIIKQTVGIDCGATELVVSLGQFTAEGDFRCKTSKEFTNSATGFRQLRQWVGKHASLDTEARYVVEATGVYHEKLACFLVAKGSIVSVVLPNKIHAFAKTCVSKKQDDLQASRVIAEFGCIKKLDEWEPPHPIYSTLKKLSREKIQLQNEKTVILNELHAEEASAFGSVSGMKRMKTRRKLIEKQISEVEKEIEVTARQVPEIWEKFKKICTIPGVGLITAVAVVSETNGFNLVRNSRQLVSYAGLDVIQKLSGTSVKGRPRISKRGNAYLRRCLYFPAITAVKHNMPLKNFYNRLMTRTEVKMKGYVGVQRKLLILIYTLWKKDESYNHKLLEQPIEAALTELD